jgi:ABC-type multidrug transport system permease subunit
MVLLNYTVYQKHKIKPLDGAEIASTIIMNFCFVATIVTGGFLGTENQMPEFIHTIHTYSPWLTILSSGLLMLLLNR